MILTDIDAKGDVGNKDKNEKVILEACPVNIGVGTSNSALLHFLPDVPWNELKTLTLEQRTKTIGSTFLCLCYQQEEENEKNEKYHARSFEDAFIQINKDFVKSHKSTFHGLKNASDFDDDEKTPYELAEKCIKKKTHFALDILYHSDEEFGNWIIPAYIKNGLLWLKED